MMLATPTLLAPHLYKKAGYDTVKDFTPVATVYDLPIVVVVNPTQMPGDRRAKADHPRQGAAGQLNYTSSGAGSFGHLSMELLKQMGGFEMQHVPYKGGVPAITDTIGGQVPLMYADLVAALPHIQAGKLRAIAVGSPQRVTMLPDVKTIAEQGFKGFDAVSWGGLLAPPGHAQGRGGPHCGEVQADPGREGNSGQAAERRCHRPFPGPSPAGATGGAGLRQMGQSDPDQGTGRRVMRAC
jgi:tripartite-type tricarboxylate transporter receptor subunit TctC